jgi:RecA-family ATPase
MLSIRDELAAYNLDAAVLLIGHRHDEDVRNGRTRVRSGQYGVVPDSMIEIINKPEPA